MRLLVLIILYSCFSFAQFVGTSVKYAVPTFQFAFESETKKITMEPNPLAEVSLLFLGPSYAFGLQFSGEKEEDKEFLESGYSDFLITYYTKNFIVDLFYRGFEDFYILDDLDTITQTNKETISGSEIGAQVLFIQEENIFEMHGEYVFAPKSSYDFFIKMRLTHSEMKGEDQIIPATYANDFSAISDIEKLTVDSLEAQMGISGLYAFDYFFINGFLSIGPSIESYLIEDSTESNNVNLISPVGEGFVGISYYQNSLQLGVRSQRRQLLSQVNGIKFSQNYISNYAYLLLFF